MENTPSIARTRERECAAHMPRSMAAITVSVLFFPLWFPAWAFCVAVAVQFDRTGEWARWLREAGLRYRYGGFTLVELSIVLVIIGLVVGGVLVGQNLIAAAAARAQVTQIEKYNTAASAFFGKYGGLPGDLRPALASQFGFVSRNGSAGQGDGNGLVSGFGYGYAAGHVIGYGEDAVFWVDLSSAGMIDGSFTSGSMSAGGDISGTAIAQYLPQAKIGNANYVYVWSLGTCLPSCYTLTGPNYFGVAAVSLIANSSNVGKLSSSPAISVAQAYAIDKKIDDGLPMSGNVITVNLSNDPCWSEVYCGTGINYDYLFGLPDVAISPSSTTCFDNGGNASNAMAYSLTQNNGNGMNCALSFKMQAGD